MTKRVKIKFNLKPEAIICDVDGTVALMHGNRGPFDWDEVWKESKKYGNIGFGEKWALYVLLGFIVFFWVITL